MHYFLKFLVSKTVINPASIGKGWTWILKAGFEWNCFFVQVMIQIINTLKRYILCSLRYILN